MRERFPIDMERFPIDMERRTRAVYIIFDVAVIPTYVQAAAEVGGLVVNVLATEGQQYTTLDVKEGQKPYTGIVPEGKSYGMISGMPKTGDLSKFWARVRELQQSEAPTVG